MDRSKWEEYADALMKRVSEDVEEGKGLCRSSIVDTGLALNDKNFSCFGSELEESKTARQSVIINVSSKLAEEWMRLGPGRVTKL